MKVRHASSTQPKGPSAISLTLLLASLLSACGGGESNQEGALARVAATSRDRPAAVTASCPPRQATPVFQGRVSKPETVLGFALGSQEVTSA
jgi:hypothetical protein